MRVAELSFDKKEYHTALYYFQRMQESASSAAMRHTAQLGILRCSHLLNDTTTTIQTATTLIESSGIDEEIQKEARYCRAKAYVAQQQYGLAVVDLNPLAKEVRTAHGAEAKYLLAHCYFQLGSIEMAEEEIMAFTQMQTTQQYWLAKSLILLADINIAKSDLFQAKQYLLALKNSYHKQDDIPSIIDSKLTEIEEAEKENSTDNIENQEETL